MSSNSADRSQEDGLARALGYPYRWHRGPVLFDPGTGTHDVHVVELGPERECLVPGIDRPLPGRAIAVSREGQTIEIDHAVALIAAGSNGAPEQLARKYRDRRDARPVLIAPATVTGAVSVYSAHITSYGSVPATMHRGPGQEQAQAALPVLLLPAEELGHINATESLGVNYVLAAPHGVSATVETVTIPQPLAYVSRRGALALDGAPVGLPGTGVASLREAAQRDMLQRVMEHVGTDEALEDFVLRMIADRDARLAVTRTMAGAGEVWALARDEVVAGGP